MADDCHSLPDHIQRLGVNGYNVRMKTISASVETPPEKQTCEYGRARTQYKQKKQGGKRENRYGLSHKNDNKTMQNRTFERSYSVTM